MPARHGHQQNFGLWLAPADLGDDGRFARHDIRRGGAVIRVIGDPEHRAHDHPGAIAVELAVLEAPQDAPGVCSLDAEVGGFERPAVGVAQRLPAHDPGFAARANPQPGRRARPSPARPGLERRQRLFGRPGLQADIDAAFEGAARPARPPA